MSDTPAVPSSSAAYPARRRLQRVLLLGVLPGVVLVVALAVYLRGGRSVETDNAYVKADKIALSAQVAGPVKEVRVHENQTVKTGDVLFRLDAAPFEVAVAKAEASLAQVGTEVAALRASYREKQAEIALAHTRQGFAERDRARQADLAARNFISAARLDDSRQAAQLASQQLEALNQDLHRIAASLGGSADRPLEAQAGWLAAKANLDQAKLDLQRIEVRAPVDGVVSNLPKPGQYLGAGATAAALVAGGKLWVEANFTETDLTHVHAGQPVHIVIDTFPGVRWQGEVDSLAPATGAEFSVIPAQNATGNWVKIAQRVPVRIRLAAAEGAPPLRAGLSATVEIETGYKRHLFGLSF
ncbi:MAG: HlyD family secretion protein [Candidatus Dactylopiibacterium sp.]|nr:HlyD family secretion protein [Candidatus Dactylopiibacterium sp.]